MSFYRGKGDDPENRYGGVPSRQPREGNHNGLDEHGDSKSLRGSRDNARWSSRSRERGESRDKEREKDRDRRGDMERDKDREENKDRGREKDSDRHHRDRHRDRSRERSEKSDRRRDGVGNDYHRSRDYDRQRDCDRDREHMHRPRSRSRRRSECRSKSRSRSRLPSERKRINGFVAPPAPAMLAASSGATVATAAAVKIPDTNPALPGVFPNMFPLATGQQHSAFPFMPVQSMTQQATRHAFRVYVRGLSPKANEKSVVNFFNHVLATIGGNTAGPGDAVVNVYTSPEQTFAFVEFRSVEEASNAMALNGIIFEGAPLKVRRPRDYNPLLAATLGPSQPSSNLNLAAVGLSVGSAVGHVEDPDRIFVGGLPYRVPEAQIKKMLERFGCLRDFRLVKDRETGNSKGYAFCVYQDVSVTDNACAHLNGSKMGDRTLTVRRANQGTTQSKPEQEIAFQCAQQQIALQRLILQPQGVPTKVVCLTQALSEDDLRDDHVYEDIVQDMKQEGGRHGTLVKVIIPRPNPNGEQLPGVGKVFLEYSNVEGSQKAQAAMNGRRFGKNQVVAAFYPENKFAQGEYVT